MRDAPYRAELVNDGAQRIDEPRSRHRCAFFLILLPADSIHIARMQQR